MEKHGTDDIPLLHGAWGKLSSVHKTFLQVEFWSEDGSICEVNASIKSENLFLVEIEEDEMDKGDEDHGSL